jgi:cytochrome b subunit of formate dehydrogenase
METYHGKSYQLGYLKSASCSDCHGAHRILKVKNPNSSVSDKNILATCQKCHLDARTKFTGFLTHATHKDKPVLHFVFIAMTTLLISVFVIFGIHNFMWLPRSFKERKKKKHAPRTGKAVYFQRFTTGQRLTHAFVIFSFLLLAFTGMLLKFAHMPWANYLANLLGGVPLAGRIHRFGAILTFGYFAYHIYSLIKMKQEKKITYKELIFGENSLMFNKNDWFDLVNTLKWFTGKGERPNYGRWTYWEKFDYMAVFWGVAVIGLSGLVLWFPEFFTRLLPGWAINVAQIIHSDEALLAVGFIFTVHFFNTHVRPDAFPMDTVIFTGHVPVEEYREDRPKEIEELEKAGKLETTVIEREISASWVRFVKIFGFTALFIGISLVLLIIYSLLKGIY